MISVFTPTHDPSFLREVHRSLVEQTVADWEWVVLHNNGSQPIGFDDPRVKEHALDFVPDWVGALKAAACARATGDVLLELDHDDLLMPTAIERTREAFERPEVGFVYSNALHCDGEFGPKVEEFSDRYGWQHRRTEFRGQALYEPRTFKADPASVSRIWYAPNHLRAFRRDAYENVGGHDRKMRVLDDLDLMCRLFCETEFSHIDEALYVYRIHGENAWLRPDLNKEIQECAEDRYERNIQQMACAWARRSGLRLLDLGGGIDPAAGYESVDLCNADVTADLEGRWPFDDSSVGVVRAFDVIEHLRDPLHTMKELSRVLAPGGWAFIQVPSTDGRGAWQDPTHRSYWNSNSFHYYTRADHARYIGTPVRFQATRLTNTPPDTRGVVWTFAHLVNLKDGYRPPGEILV